ncbi:hypothetical protein ACFQI7_28185 [Paenibacillus allorhizosphaerae]|uniref:Uncharacterized protein n=1 Tax=Paenibacillus allorhizosphaerae TaxID=2849866 RepID=A0ABM8VNJ7_9BACL|nr:hypothetical protein [Paenibacillus allorhizosphaerae]CAG7651469.1 hypothetical protein PAECIP111802_04972 [Paenibacillus allorhizosphaerae]
MKFCLYEAKNDRIVQVEDDILVAASARRALGRSNEISLLPIISKEEYESFPFSFRGEVNGRYYLFYEVPGIIPHKYDQVIVVDRYDDVVLEE